MFMVHHPLEGRREREIACLDLRRDEEALRHRGAFHLRSEAWREPARAGVHNNATLFWNLYPGYVRDIFTRAFTEGLRDPSARVRESEWRTVFTPHARPDLLLPQVRRGEFPGR